MGRLDKIRDIHPGMNILRTLSYWNTLQKKRYNTNNNNPGASSDNFFFDNNSSSSFNNNNNSIDGMIVHGGQLGIVPKNHGRTNLIMMTLMGEYSHKCDWEYDAHFSFELERFVEDALQFHLCLNGKANAAAGDGGGGGGGSSGGNVSATGGVGNGNGDSNSAPSTYGDYANNSRNNEVASRSSRKSWDSSSRAGGSFSLGGVAGGGSLRALFNKAR